MHPLWLETNGNYTTSTLALALRGTTSSLETHSLSSDLILDDIGSDNDF